MSCPPSRAGAPRYAGLAGISPLKPEKRAGSGLDYIPMRRMTDRADYVPMAVQMEEWPETLRDYDTCPRRYGGSLDYGPEEPEPCYQMAPAKPFIDRGPNYGVPPRMPYEPITMEPFYFDERNTMALQAREEKLQEMREAQCAPPPRFQASPLPAYLRRNREC